MADETPVHVMFVAPVSMVLTIETSVRHCGVAHKVAISAPAGFASLEITLTNLGKAHAQSTTRVTNETKVVSVVTCEHGRRSNGSAWNCWRGGGNVAWRVRGATG